MISVGDRVEYVHRRYEDSRFGLTGTVLEAPRRQGPHDIFTIAWDKPGSRATYRYKLRKLDEAASFIPEDWS